MAEQGSHKPRVGGSSPPAATTLHGGGARLRLALEPALPLLPLPAEPLLVSTLRDGVDDADENAEHDDAGAEKDGRHTQEAPARGIMNRSYRRGKLSPNKPWRLKSAQPSARLFPRDP